MVGSFHFEPRISDGVEHGVLHALFRSRPETGVELYHRLDKVYELLVSPREVLAERRLFVRRGQLTQILEDAVFSYKSHVFLGGTALLVQNDLQLVRLSDDVDLLLIRVLALLGRTFLFVTRSEGKTRCSWK